MALAPPFPGLLQDVAHALRSLARRPGFAAVAVATLALGIGANAAIFSLVEAVLLRGLPFHEPARLVAVGETNAARHRVLRTASQANYVRWDERNRSFQSMAAYGAWTTTLTGKGDPARLPVGMVTPTFFATLGVRPALGRAFLAADSAPGAQAVAVLSDGLWRSRYASDPDVVGSKALLDGRPVTIVGVMPPQVDLPHGSELWLPVTVDAAFREANGRWLTALARLRPGVSVEQARADMEVIARNLERERPQSDTGWGVAVAPLHQEMVASVRPQILLLMAGVVLLLVMACVNVASLLLSRALTRLRELAVRAALGAGRGRLVRQFLTESLVLCAIGSAAGLALGQVALRVLAASLPADVPGFMEPRLGATVVAFTGAACLLATLVTGLVPALRLSGAPLLPALKEGNAGTGVGPARRRLRGLLVAGQMALALVLVSGGGLLLRSYARLSRVDAGFDARQVLSLSVTLPETAYAEPARQARFFQQAVDALRTLPGVTAAAGMSWLPLTAGSATKFELPDRPLPAPGEAPSADVRFVTPGLFGTLGIPLREGRDFAPEDGPDRPTVVVVNESLARASWPGQSALGKRVKMEWDGTRDAVVVGVVGDVRLRSLDARSGLTLYWAQSQVPSPFMTLVVKSPSSEPLGLAAAGRGAIAGIDKDVAVESQPLEGVVAGSLQQRSFTLALTLAFGATAILLASVGLFGVVGQAVGERHREFALRSALGATGAQIRGLVLREGFRWTALGAAVGVPAALLAGHTLRGFLFEVSPQDPATYAAVLAVLLAAALVAVLVPAWRAARVHPRVVLRGD